MAKRSVDSLARRGFRFLTKLYPSRLRIEYEDEMALLFREMDEAHKRQRPGNALARAWFWLRVGGDILVSVSRAHRFERRHARRGHGSERSSKRRRAKTTSEPRRKESGLMSTWMHDLKVAARLLTTQPGFTIVAAITLALGIGANTAIFSVVYGVLLRPLGLQDPGSIAIVRLHRINNEGDASGFFPTYFEDLRERVEPTPPIEQLTSFIYESATWESEDRVEALSNVLMVDGRFFDVMGAQPLLGRLLDESDVIPNQRGNVCVLGESLWRTRFGSDPNTLGKTLVLNGKAVVVVGIVPANLPLPDATTNVWMTQGWDPEDAELFNRLGVLARLSTPDGLEAARQVFSSAANQLAPDYARFDGYTMSLQGFQEGLVGTVRPAIGLSGIAVGIILLIACANTANLLLSRASVRETEMATRRAIGARHAQLASQLLAESVALALLGGAFGVVVAFAFHRLLLAVAPTFIPRLDSVRLDLPVLGFAALLSIGTGLVFGLAPLLHALGSKSLSSPTESRIASGRRFMTQAFVVSQVALSIVLLVAAALLVRSLGELKAVDPGFRVEGIAGARIYLDNIAYPEDREKENYFRQLLQRIEERGDIVSAGASSGLPMDPITIDYDLPYTIPGRETVEEEIPQAYFRTVTPNYFETMQIPLKKGRVFDGRDRADAQPVAIINESFSRIGWPGSDPVGKSFFIYGGRKELTVVGIVGDVHFASPAAAFKPEFFVPHPQTPYDAMTVVARSANPETAEAAATIIAEEALALDPTHPVANHFALSSLVAGTLATNQFLAFLLSCFAAIALAISTAGIYGVLSYWISQSRREFGVRIAFGAGVRNIFELVLRRGLGLTAAGLLVGLGASILLTRLMTRFLFEVHSSDALSLVAAIALLGAAATLSTLIPAWRAAHLDPMRSLRQD